MRSRTEDGCLELGFYSLGQVSLATLVARRFRRARTGEENMTSATLPFGMRIETLQQGIKWIVYLLLVVNTSDSWQVNGQFGDLFGGFTALVSGLAFA